jgi:lipopolysaccharide biosynthesis protein
MKWNRHLIPAMALAAALIACVHDYCSPREMVVDFVALKPAKNATVFAAYSADGKIDDYVITYLKALKEVSPNIVYVTDNPITKLQALKLKPYVTHLEARRHEEYDWGSYKRGVRWLKSQGYPASRQDAHGQTPYLILANDSTLLVADKIPLPKTDDPADFYGITSSFDLQYHLQSYFLIFTPKVYTHPAFADYLEKVRRQQTGLLVAFLYEVPFTKAMQDLGFTAKILLDEEGLKEFELNDKNCYPLSLITRFHDPFLKMRVWTERLNVQESRKLLIAWLKKNAYQSYKDLRRHLRHIGSPYAQDFQ